MFTGPCSPSLPHDDSTRLPNGNPKNLTRIQSSRFLVINHPPVFPPAKHRGAETQVWPGPAGDIGGHWPSLLRCGPRGAQPLGIASPGTPAAQTHLWPGCARGLTPGSAPSPAQVDIGHRPGHPQGEKRLVDRSRLRPWLTAEPGWTALEGWASRAPQDPAVEAECGNQTIPLSPFPFLVLSLARATPPLGHLLRPLGLLF